MRNTFIVFLLIGIPGANASAGAQEPQSTPSRFLFTIDEQRTTDVQRSVLARAMAAEVPREQWATVRAAKGDSLLTLIKRYYGIYSTKDASNPYSKPLPQTTSMVLQLIRDANPDIEDDVIHEGAQLRMPPLPVRPKNGKGVSANVRAFDPRMSHTYSLVGASGVRGVTSIGLRTIDQLQPVRDVRSTVVALSSTNPALSEAVLASAPTSDDPSAAMPPELGIVQVRLLKTDAQCAGAAAALDQSPYLTAAKARIGDALTKMKERLKNRHLRLIDFDFRTDHGLFVEGAAHWLLHSMGADSLIDGILKSELNPRIAQQDLGQTINDYYTKGKADPTGAAFASLWVFTAPREEGKAVRTVHAVIVQSQLWRALLAGDVTSLSWQVVNPTGVRTLQQRELLESKGSVVVVAAGNDADQEIEDLFPQSEARNRPEFVNATYGSVDGEPFGSITGTATGGRVDLMAPGCGIDYEKLDARYFGSSFASPIVAASAWLKMLLDNTAPADLRRELLKASLLLPPRSKAVTISGGFFDPARLIANVGPHYLDPSRKNIVPIRDLNLDGASCGTLRLSDDNRAHSDAIVYRLNQNYFLLTRREVAGFQGAEARACQLTSLRGSIATPNGVLTIPDPASFVNSVGHLTF